MAYKQCRITLPIEIYEEIKEVSEKTNIPAFNLVIIAWKRYRASEAYKSLVVATEEKGK